MLTDFQIPSASLTGGPKFCLETGRYGPLEGTSGDYAFPLEGTSATPAPKASETYTKVMNDAQYVIPRLLE